MNRGKNLLLEVDQISHLQIAIQLELRARGEMILKEINMGEETRDNLLVPKEEEILQINLLTEVEICLQELLNILKRKQEIGVHLQTKMYLILEAI